MRFLWKVGAVALAMSAAAVSANAAVITALAPGVISPAGVSVDFESSAIGAFANTTIGSVTFTNDFGSVQVLNLSNSDGALPFGDNSRYLTITGGASETLTFSTPQTRLGFYYGSVDNYNTITFSNGVVLTGSDFASALLQPDGGQFDFDSNRYVYLTPGAFTSVTLSSAGNSFELDNISAGVPEPGTWAMMLLGFAGLAVASLRQRRRVSSATA